MARYETYKKEMECYNNYVVDFVDSYTLGCNHDNINFCFCDCLMQLSYMRKLDLISPKCFDDHLIELLHFYKVALSDLEE